MKKDFNDFMEHMNSLDLSLIAEKVTNGAKDGSIQTQMSTMLYTMTEVLRQYHEWSNS